MTTPVTNSSTLPTGGAFSASTSGRAAGISTDFETFLRLLTTQARYQDPLEPLDSQEYASQLAQFSMVEQQVQGNDLLAGMQAQLSLSAMATVTQWVGMEARAAVPGHFDGSTPIAVSPNPVATADDVRLIVKNEDGTEVNRILLPVSAEPYNWDGTDADGNVLPSGSYSFTMESYRDDELLLSETAEIYSSIRETQLQGNQVILIMNGGSAISSTDVTALRDPGA
ncbi:flagellar basal body rod modification protein [Epibacterium sp. SM1969]|uniref:Basal-body rod modification protein FlgD n=1 Tax=Tritonibacter aquimaris TaxID=2663379 RepID=A0A844AXY4_9RHOB|nr:flagellar hook capping FlgD N-terminal domain-containing protein [Tritonibacter aquimaris]MQY42036.1 flagellar basal body rod modification protein [Tritonibacter aquimaris]